MILNASQTARLKEIELEMFKEFIKVCEKLNLKYYVGGGTLLGAVRHKGFIPWDDDIDVGMPREDYEIFVNEGQKYLPEHLFIQTYKTDPEYPQNFAKIRNSNTTFIESTVKTFHMNHGVFIDVFPYDYGPDPKREKAVAFKKWIFETRIYYEFCLERKETVKSKLFEGFLKAIFPSYAKVLAQREKLYKSGTNKSVIISNCGMARDREGVPAEWYDGETTLLFEGIEVTAPKEFDKLLSFMYGDYMKLPPEDKRMSHHYTEVIDLERPYTDYFHN